MSKTVQKKDQSLLRLAIIKNHQQVLELLQDLNKLSQIYFEKEDEQVLIPGQILKKGANLKKGTRWKKKLQVEKHSLQNRMKRKKKSKLKLDRNKMMTSNVSRQSKIRLNRQGNA